MCKRSMSLGVATGHLKAHGRALCILASFKFYHGEHSITQLYAHESRRLAQISGELYTEAQAARIEALCWSALGRYKECLSLCATARDFLVLCGMSGSVADIAIMNTQAEVYKDKSEYGEARNIHTWIIQNVTAEQDAYCHAVSLTNLAEIEVSMGVPKDNVQSNIDCARILFIAVGLRSWITICDTALAALYLRERNLQGAKLLLEKCLKADLDSEIKSFCLGQLGNVREWDHFYSMSMWTTIFLAHSLKCKMNLQAHKALQFFGDMFLDQNDKDTAISLFTLALEGFTYMDVHCGRAECMLRLGDISHGCGDPLKAMGFWEAARPLFKCSSQAQQVANIDDRLASMSREIQVQHKKNSAKLVELNVHSDTAEEAEE
ncbi:hypothetical protein B0H14DRAFT_623303 [Mycena olivaceomarginata]|nr:hypothetical protein B0H14DRAFT_623303 [Mycena olivaceomarginata]